MRTRRKGQTGQYGQKGRSIPCGKEEPRCIFSDVLAKVQSTRQQPGQRDVPTVECLETEKWKKKRKRVSFQIFSSMEYALSLHGTQNRLTDGNVNKNFVFSISPEPDAGIGIRCPLDGILHFARSEPSDWTTRTFGQYNSQEDAQIPPRS